MPQIDSKGVYRGTIIESGFGVTSKNSYPQWIARLAAAEKYIEDPTELAHFQGQGLLADGPGWVDWSSYNEDILAYLVLFKSADTLDDSTKMLNYDQVVAATGWDGQAFDALCNGEVVGKKILFRVEENSYVKDNGQTHSGLQVNWIDAFDAPPQRQLKSLDSDKVAALTKLLKIGTKKPAAPAKPATPAKPGAAVPTKPAAAPAKPTAAAPATKPGTATAPTAQPAPAKTTAPTAPVTPPSAKPASKAPPKAAPAPVEEPAIEEQQQEADQPTGLAIEATQGDAWEVVTANKGGTTDADLQEAWIAACKEVLGSRDEDQATGKDWAKVRDTVIRDLALTIAA